MNAPQAPAQTGRYIHANGIDIYYESYGSGQPLLLLHGGTGNLSMWASYIPTFAQHFHVHAVDSRGHGRTKNPADTLSYRLLADDMMAFLQALKLEKAIVCGYSDGGQIALELALHYPQLIAAQVIAGAGHRWSEGYLAWAKTLGMEQQGMVDINHIERHHSDLIAGLRERQDAFQGPEYWKTYLRHISMLWLEPITYTTLELQRIATPTLILSGDRDETFFPAEIAVELYRSIPQAELAMIPGTGHDFPFETPDLFSQITLNFLLRQHSSTT